MSDTDGISEDLVEEAKVFVKQEEEVDELEGKLVDLQSFLQTLTSAGVMCKNDAIALESISEGILTEKVPINSFTTDYSKTNYALAIKQTQISIESIALAVGAAIVAAIIAIIAWIVKSSSGKSSTDKKIDALKKAEEDIANIRKRRDEAVQEIKDIFKKRADDLDSSTRNKGPKELLEELRKRYPNVEPKHTGGVTIDGVFEEVKNIEENIYQKAIDEHYTELVNYLFRDGVQLRNELIHKFEIAHTLDYLKSAISADGKAIDHAMLSKAVSSLRKCGIIKYAAIDTSIQPDIDFLSAAAEGMSDLHSKIREMAKNNQNKKITTNDIRNTHTYNICNELNNASGYYAGAMDPLQAKFEKVNTKLKDGGSDVDKDSLKICKQIIHIAAIYKYITDVSLSSFMKYGLAIDAADKSIDKTYNNAKRWAEENFSS